MLWSNSLAALYITITLWFRVLGLLGLRCLEEAIGRLLGLLGLRG